MFDDEEQNSSWAYEIIGALRVRSISHLIIELLFLFKAYVTPAATDPIATSPIPAQIPAGKAKDESANSASIKCTAIVPPIPPPIIPKPPPIPPPIAVFVERPKYP